MPAQSRVPPINPTLAYVAPFAAFVALMGIEHAVNLPAGWFYPIRIVVVTAILLVLSRPYLSLRVQKPWLSIGVGIAVFLIWIGPDVLFGPAYRHHWLFENSVTGAAKASVVGYLQLSTAFIAVRLLGSVALVPIIEELFWRGWLMRWLMDMDFLKVPLGRYSASAFWIVAALFASEHGPYWEVGLAAGIIYNWWLIRTKSLGDCILAHAITNGLLGIYVVAAGQWQYWL
jgi:CAAX prenyl protease-like protein